MSELGPIATAFWRLSLALLPLIILAGNASRRSAATNAPRFLGEHITAALPGVFSRRVWRLGGWLFLRQRISRVFLVGLAISILGIVVLKGGPSSAFQIVGGVGVIAGIFVAKRG